MYLASLSELPSMPVFLTRSEPARSTRCSLERRTTSLPALRRSTAMVKRQCEREEAWLRLGLGLGLGLGIGVGIGLGCAGCSSSG